MRTLLSITLAILGNILIGFGLVVNMVGLGGNIGYIPMFLGLLLIGISMVPIRSVSINIYTYIFIIFIRYLSFPLLLVSIYFLSYGIYSIIFEDKTIHGIFEGFILILFWIFGIAWPELNLLYKKIVKHH